MWRTSCENPFQTGSKVVKSKKMLYTYAIRIWKRIRTQEVTMGRYLNPGNEYIAGICLRQPPTEVWKIHGCEYAYGILQQRL